MSLNGSATQSTENFFTASTTFNFSDKFVGEYGGTSYSKGLKVESKTSITFTTTKVTTVTIVQAQYNDKNHSSSNDNTIKFDSNELALNSGNVVSGYVRIYTVADVAAGTHTISKGNGESGLFFVSVEEQDASKAVKPVISFTEGATYHSASTVTITTSTENATIYYTTDGTDPTTSSTQYTAAFEVNSACTVKAIAVADGLSNSDVASQAVTLNSKHTITYDFSGVTLTQGSALSGTTATDGSSYTLPKGRLYYVEGQTQTGWSDGTNTYALGGNVTINGNTTFTPVFAENSVALGAAAATVNWTFATNDGAPSAGLEGNIGYYAAQTTINNTPLDVVMKINTIQDAGVSGSKGKWNTTSATNRAQVNKGTVFTIPAKKGMVVTYTATHGSPEKTNFSFAGNDADAVDDKKVTYTYNGTAETIDIIELKGDFYPGGISVAYPEEEQRTESDLTITSPTEVTLTASEPTAQITATTSATVGLTYTSSNNLIATVNANGLITAVANGTATITVSQTGDAVYQDDSKTVTVTVNNGVVPSYSVEAILNNETGTILTSSDMAAQGTAFSFGVNSANTRVAADAADAVVAIAGNYYNDHGSTNLVITVQATGNMKFTIGNCTYNNGAATLKDAQDNTIKSVSLSGTGCWKGSHTDITTLFYEGDATTLTLSIPSYCPYIKVESVGEIAKYTVTFMNGSTQVAQTEVIQGENVGSLPTPDYDSSSKLFLGWYGDTSDMGSKVATTTVPTTNVTYNAIITNIPTATAGYLTPTNATELVAAIQYANQTSSANNQVKIFLKNGTYDLGSIAEIFQITGSYVSLIGESLDGTIITNIPTQEGLGTATLLYNKGQYNYLQDLTLHNNYPYGNSTGRAASLKDEGNYTICNNVWLYSHQDTYYSHRNGAYFYFKGGKISGCVDYMCGQSRVYFDAVTLSNDNKTTYMTANSELYVFNNCTVENDGSTYYWGRAWSSVNNGPVCVFLNTTLKDNGSKIASSRWNPTNMNTTYVEGTGEYGTKNASGDDITPTSNEVQFTYTEDKVTKNGNKLNTILTEEQAATYTMAYTLGDWATTAASDVEQATVSNVKLNGSTLSWEGTSDAYLVEKDGEFVALTSETTYTVSGLGNYTVRAANVRGGFGEAVEATGGKVTLTWNIAVGTSATDITSTQTPSTEIISTMTAISATKNDSSGKENLTVKLNCGTSSSAAAATVSFTVPEGYAFVPYTAKAKVQPIAKDAYVSLALTDATNTLSNSAVSFTQGTITTSTLTAAETKYYTGTVTLGIYCYDGASTGVTTYRLGTPVTISGELVPAVKITPTGYATFSSAYPLDFTEEIEGLDAAYYASAVAKGSVTMTELSQTVSASTGLFLKGTPGATVYIPVAEEGTDITGTNYLKPNTTATDIAASTTETYHYVFAYNNSEPYEPGFFNLASAVTLPGGKAYLESTTDLKPTPQAKVSILFVDADLTGINDVKGTMLKTQGEVYNLGGQRVGNGYKGIVIVNGKKVLK